MSSDNKPKNSDIDFVTKIDFTKGFSSFHMRWPINTSYFTKEVESPYFETEVEHENGTMVFGWFLWIKKYDNGVWIGLLRKKLPVPHGIIFRLALCDGDKKLWYNKTYFRVFSNDILPGFGSSFTMEEIKAFGGDDLVLHCWMDIPVDFVKKGHAYLKKYKQCDDEFLETGSFRLKCSNNFLTDFSQLFDGVLNGDPLSDVTLAIMDEESGQVQRQFFCHRLVLAARSPVFKTMFANNQWKEGAAKDERIVEINDINDETMEHVLRYIYTGYLFPVKDLNEDSSLECEDFLDIVNAAEKYMLPGLKDFCTAHLICYAYSDADRFEQILVVDKYHLDQLKAVCFAPFTSDPEGIEDEDNEISKELLMELYNAMAKRNMNMKEISLTD